MKQWLQSGEASFSKTSITEGNALALAYKEAFHPSDVRGTSGYVLRHMVFHLLCQRLSPQKFEMQLLQSSVLDAQDPFRPTTSPVSGKQDKPLRCKGV